MSHAIGLQEFDDGWLPIETAPKDGTEILVNLSYNVAMYIVFFENDQWLTSDGFKWPQSAISHWRPLPPPPKEID